jgi:hypothetical protein
VENESEEAMSCRKMPSKLPLATHPQSIDSNASVLYEKLNIRACGEPKRLWPVANTSYIVL